VTVDIPLAELNQVQAGEFGWQVPGLRQELVTELIRSLPKHLRRLFVPAPETARAVLGQLGEPCGDLLDALGAQLHRISGVPIPRTAWDPAKLPQHLRVTFRVVSSGQVLASDKDLAELRRQLRPRLQAALTDAAQDIIKTGLRSWDIGSLPRSFTDGQVRGYPALADTGDAVDVRLFDTQSQAREAMWGGTRRLLLIAVPAGVRGVASRLPTAAKLAMSRHPYPGTADLLDDCAACAADEVIAGAGGPSWDAAGYARILDAARTSLAATSATVVAAVARVLQAAQAAQAALDRATGPAAALDDIRSQLSGLIYPGFVSATGARRLPDLVRYLQAISRRLEKLPADPVRDAGRMAAVHRVTDAYQRAVARPAQPGQPDPGAQEIRWMIEELRVSLFAQTLGTPGPVSEQRIQRALDRLTA
jgi:ATP-dependent helicase HrpA